MKEEPNITSVNRRILGKEKTFLPFKDPSKKPSTDWGAWLGESEEQVTLDPGLRGRARCSNYLK